MSGNVNSETIVAIATPPGAGGVGIVRISGAAASDIAQRMLGECPPPRQANYTSFLDFENNVIDQGIALFFKAPNSFTGEDILELQGHGGKIVMDMLVQNAILCGARAARAGEFSERAFLNSKIDLTQAEAIADLISAESEQAAKAALHSLQGAFSEQVNTLVEALTQLRMHVEAALDFPEEEIDFIADSAIQHKLDEVEKNVQYVKQSAMQGRLLKEGMSVVIAGRPNAGKSSLLNALAGHASAIVTDVPGTTRDVLREHIQIDGLPLHIIDTAGLRESDNVVEQEGIRRAHAEINKADRVLYLMDAASEKPDTPSLPDTIALTCVHNKIDLLSQTPRIECIENVTHVYLSAKSGEGVDILKQHLKQSMGYQQQQEGRFIARRRHLEAIELAAQHLQKAQYTLKTLKAGELLAEELRSAQQALSSITGEFSSDDLLGRIFADFCIGK
jgi:tRNA modification GTPase